jgi:hypothetical protein
MSTSLEAATPEYEASVQQHYAAQGLVQSIALAPLACPRELDCEDLEKEIVEQLAERTGLRIVTATEVSALMAQASVTDLDNYEGRLIIGEGLRVDAFAFVKVIKAESESVAPPQNDKWKDLKRQSSVKRASLELRIVARDGNSLARVSGEAQLFDTLKGLPNITVRLFAVMLERAWS